MAATTNRMPRLYVELELDGTSLALDESEAHYLGHVLRLTPGRRLVVFNGRGTEREARAVELELDIEARQAVRSSGHRSSSSMRRRAVRLL